MMRWEHAQGKVRREAIVTAIAAYWGEHGYAPSVREVAAAVGVASSGSLHGHLAALRAAGRISWRVGATRTLRVVEESNATNDG